jgi:hypothetical protein
MDRDEVVSLLRAHAAELKRLGVSHLFLFGSLLRDQAGPSSDVDLFFDFDSPRFSVVELVALQERISRLVGRKADVMSRRSIHPRLRSAIVGSALQVF